MSVAGASRPPQRLYPPASGVPRGGRVRVVVAPERRCLAIDGVGPRGGHEFAQATASLYATVFSLHVLLLDRGLDAPIRHVETQWERRDGAEGWPETSMDGEPDRWRWTQLLPIPEAATDEDLASAMAVARHKHPAAALHRLLVLTVREGLVVEAVHTGPPLAALDTLARMRVAADAGGLSPHGPLHEVHITDPRRTRPARLRTLLRQPLR